MTAAPLPPVPLPANQREGDIVRRYRAHQRQADGCCAACGERFPCEQHHRLWYLIATAGLPLPDKDGWPATPAASSG